MKNEKKLSSSSVLEAETTPDISRRPTRIGAVSAAVLEYANPRMIARLSAETAGASGTKPTIFYEFCTPALPVELEDVGLRWFQFSTYITQPSNSCYDIRVRSLMYRGNPETMRGDTSAQIKETSPSLLEVSANELNTRSPAYNGSAGKAIETVAVALDAYAEVARSLTPERAIAYGFPVKLITSLLPVELE